jgi:hypothetical protein
MGNLARRLVGLEREAAAEARERERGALSPLERDLYDLPEVATVEESEELFALLDARRDEGRDGLFDPVEDYRILELVETLLDRAGSYGAEEIRLRRDMLSRDLDRLEREWKAAGRKNSTWQSDKEFWMVTNAATNRRDAVRYYGARLITDPGEAARIVRRVRSPDTTSREMRELVTR